MKKLAIEFEKGKAPFLGGHSFACNPVGAAIGNLIIDYIKENKIVENSLKMEDVFLDKLKRLHRHEIVGNTRGMGLYLGVEFVSDKETKLPFAKEFNISKKLYEHSNKKTQGSKIFFELDQLNKT
ncbi:aminotransferase class III-fold pyridoxal phosphate-dependent enzyme [Flavobacterium sp. ZT3R18]|nr:aminotransferase class III-fold pyridoxal phosphate-dependent enzyme [Flavobacterium sp. ZT3R18]